MDAAATADFIITGSLPAETALLACTPVMLQLLPQVLANNYSTARRTLMNKRKLGRSDLQVAPLAFGGNVFGWTADKVTSFKLLDEFVDSGLNLIDTADVYSSWKPGNKGGESESIIGEWIKRSGKREQVVIATKCGMEGTVDQKNLSPAYIKRAVEQSLKRLGIDHIDLYQAHVDDEKVPLQETLAAFDELIRQGKVRVLGASNYSGERLSEALQVSKQWNLARYESLQPEYNLYDRSGFESELAPVCLKEGIGAITYFSLARGFLSGKYRSEADLAQSERGEGVKKYLNERGYRILKALDEISAKHHTTATVVALAWVMARPAVTAAIASATKIEQLQDLIASARLELDSQDMEQLNQTGSELTSTAR